MKIITKDATVYSDQGLIDNTKVMVCDHGDTISIGQQEHNKTDLIIREGVIAPLHNDTHTTWEVTW